MRQSPQPPKAPKAQQAPESETLDAGNATYSVTLPSFEGPLDLLLHLCQKHELDILDIPIGFVTEKYLEYLSIMQLASTQFGLDVASESLVMAATLAHIKSKMLPAGPLRRGRRTTRASSKRTRGRRSSSGSSSTKSTSRRRRTCRREA